MPRADQCEKLRFLVNIFKQNYKLGDPLNPETTLGPMVKAKAADFVRGQIDEAGKVIMNATRVVRKEGLLTTRLGISHTLSLLLPILQYPRVQWHTLMLPRSHRTSVAHPTWLLKS
jgi:hypothetical protein